MKHRRADNPPLGESNLEAFELTDAAIAAASGGASSEAPFTDPPHGYIEIGGVNGTPPPNIQ